MKQAGNLKRRLLAYPPLNRIVTFKDIKSFLGHEVTITETQPGEICVRCSKRNKNEIESRVEEMKNYIPVTAFVSIKVGKQKGNRFE